LGGRDTACGTIASERPRQVTNSRDKVSKLLVLEHRPARQPDERRIKRRFATAGKAALSVKNFVNIGH
jgi:hypothetical protein